MNSITMTDLKAAMSDERFRKSLPEEFAGDIAKYLKNPGCACNVPLYRKLVSKASTQLREYFPNKNVSQLAEADKINKNRFSVINCSKDELEDALRKLPPGRKQLAVARFEDQITVIVNELETPF